MQIHVLQSTVSDNYFYLLAGDDGSDGLLIDPIDADVALAALERHGVSLRYLVNTHGHPDHTRGNGRVQAQTGVPLYAHQGDQSWIGTVDHPLDAGDTLEVGDTRLQVLFTPGHTPGHISLFAPGHLFCGDTIFIAGAGHCRFGGHPPTLYQTYRDVLAHLPDDTTVYCGHNYAVRNLEFALSLDPNSEPAKDKLAAARTTEGHCLATLGEERRYNPFMRVGDEAFLASLRSSHPDAVPDDADEQSVFVAIRGLRDNW